MKTQLAIFASIVAGGVIGGAAVQGLRAQGKPTAYVVIEIHGVHDADALKTIAEKAASSGLEAAGGRYIVRTNEITGLDGTPPKRFVLIAFDSAEKARAWHESQGQKDVEAVRVKLTDSNSFMVVALPN